MSDRARLVALLAAITSLGPFAMQSLAPALPVVARDFAVSVEAAQTMLSLSVLAIALATLILGPLSDYFGRRPVALASMAVAILASLGVVFAPTLELAVAARFVQAGAAGAGMVLGRAIARDRFGPHGAGEVIAQMTAVMVVVPMVAPVVGGALTEAFGWRMIFAATALYAAVVLIWALIQLTETIEERSSSAGPVEMARSFRAVAGVRRFWAYCIVAAATLASFLFFVGVAPHVAATGFDADPAVYGLGFILISLGYIASNLLYARLAGRVGGDALMLIGLVGSMAASGGVAVAIWLGWTGLITVFAASTISSLFAGLVVPNAMAGAVSAYPARAGAASSLLGFVQFALAAVAVQLGAGLPHGSAGPMSAVMCGLTGFGLVAFLGLRGGGFGEVERFR
jgi:DHA1 family bicyclomycin/chloramphenicol resistance-like MFS transporter